MRASSMRKLYFICLFFLFMAFGCADRSADVSLAEKYPEFQAYEELLVSAPDSAISQIKAFEERTKLSKNYTDSVHLCLVKAYMKKAGSYLRNWNKTSSAEGNLQVVEGMVESLTYLDAMDENQETMLLRGNAYCIMGDAFLYVLNSPKELECHEQAYSYYAKVHENMRMFSTAAGLAVVYHINQDSKKAEMYCHKGDSLYALLNDTSKVYHFCCHINRVKAYLLYEENQKEKAYALIYGKMNGEESQYIRDYYGSVLADFYYKDKVPDSAIVYAERTIELEQSSYVDYYEMLIELYQKKGDSIKASYYTSELANLTKNNYTQTSEKSEMVSVYEQYKSDRAAALKSTRHKSIALWLGGVLGIVLAFLLPLLFHKRKRMVEEGQKKDWYIGVLSGKVKQNKAELGDKEKQLQALKDELDKMKTEQVDVVPGLDVEERMKHLKAKPICVHILTSVDTVIKTRADYPELLLSDKQQTELVNAVSDAFYRFPSRLKETYPRLTPSDIVYCCFCLLGLNDKQVAAFTGKAYQTVWVRSNKIRQIFNSSLPVAQVLTELLDKWYGRP